MSKRHPFTAMLGLISYGLICGAQDVKSIWRKCGALDENQRRAMGLTKRSKATGRLTMPGYDAINDLINKIDPKSMSEAINNWLLKNSDSLTKTLAIDGKDLGGKGQLGAIVTLCHSNTGMPLAMDTYSGGKDDCELPTTKALLAKEELSLNQAVITNDALGTQKTAFQIVNKGGDYLSALKENQPTLYKDAQVRLDHQDATYICPFEKSHGRIEHRELRCYTIEESISSFPLSRQLLSLKRRFTDVKSGKVSEENRQFITSLEENERRPKDLARIIREHWSVEHKNHWRRGTCRWKEDKTSTRNPKAAKNLALLRGVLFALIPFHEHDSLNGAMDHYSNHPWQALSLANKSRLINH